MSRSGWLPYSVAVVSYLGKLVHVRVAHTRG